MKIALILSGILATLAMVAPSLVALGFVFFIIPGLVLLAAPTVFAYLAVTMAIRWSLPYESNVLKTAIGFVGALVAGSVVMVSWNFTEVAKYESCLLPDVAAIKPIKLSGNVLIQRKNAIVGPESEFCDYLCTAILDLPDVKSVTVDYKRNTAAFKLVSAKQCSGPGLLPFEPGNILDNDPAAKTLPELIGSEQKKAAKNSIEAGWALRLAKDERLIAQPSVSADQADWIVRIVDQKKRGKVKIRRVEIVDSNDTVQLRKSHVSYNVPARLFFFGFDANSITEMDSSGRFQVGKYNLRTDNNIPQLELEPTLLSAIKIPLPNFNPHNMRDLQGEIQRTLDDPDATIVELELVRRWMATFFCDVAEEDFPLVAKVVADERIKDITESMKLICHKHETPAIFWSAFAKRILMKHSTVEDRFWYARKLASMPPGTFAKPQEVHWEIWNDKYLVRQAAPFIECLADLGPEAGTSALLEAMENALELGHWSKRCKSIDAIRAGFERLGPGAAEAAPRIKQLMGYQRSPIMNSYNDRKAWEAVLARMEAVTN